MAKKKIDPESKAAADLTVDVATGEIVADAQAPDGSPPPPGLLWPPPSGPVQPPAFPAQEKRIQKVLASKVLAAIHKAHGANLIQIASESAARHVYRIPSDIYPLDSAIGGGWLVGRIHTVYGPKGGGKTSAILRTIGNAQKMCTNCWTTAEWFDPETGIVYEKPKCECKKFREAVVAYIDVEGTLDLAWARKLGVDTDRLLLSQPEYAEQSIDIAEALLRSGEIDILVLDSIAFLTPAKEIEESAAKETMGVQPRAVGKGIRKFVAAMNWASNQGRKPTLFFTNQIRMKIGVVFGNPETQSGGMAPGFSATTEVRLSQGQYKMESLPKDSPAYLMARPLYVDLQFKVEKNKSYVPRMEGAYRLILLNTETKHVGQVYDEHVILDDAERLGVLRKDGGSWICAGQEFDARSHIERKMLLEPIFKGAVRETLFKLQNPS